MIDHQQIIFLRAKNRFRNQEAKNNRDGRRDSQREVLFKAFLKPLLIGVTSIRYFLTDNCPGYVYQMTIHDIYADNSIVLVARRIPQIDNSCLHSSCTRVHSRVECARYSAIPGTASSRATRRVFLALC